MNVEKCIQQTFQFYFLRLQFLEGTYSLCIERVEEGGKKRKPYFKIVLSLIMKKYQLCSLCVYLKRLKRGLQPLKDCETVAYTDLMNAIPKYLYII